MKHNRNITRKLLHLRSRNLRLTILYAFYKKNMLVDSEEEALL